MSTKTKQSTPNPLQLTNNASPSDPAFEALEKLNADIKAAAALMDRRSIRCLVDMYYQIQEFRKRTSNQIRSRGQGEPDRVISWADDNMRRIEENIKKALGKFAEQYTIGQRLLSIHETSKKLEQKLEQDRQQEQAAKIKALIDRLNNTVMASEKLCEDLIKYPGMRIQSRALVRIYPEEKLPKQADGTDSPYRKIKISAQIILEPAQKELMFQIARELEISPQEFIASYLGFTYQPTLIPVQE